MLSKGGRLNLSVYVDADYANKANDRRSVFGVVVMLGDTSAMIQICVESSTTHGVLEYSTRVCTRLNILIA